MSDGSVVDAALAIWSDRVRKCVELDTLAKEPKMHSILHRFAQLNYAYSETYEAVMKICSTDDGLRAFLAPHAKDSPFDTLDSYSFVEDAFALAERINASALKHEYSWLASHITATERANGIGDRSGRLKGRKRSGEGNSA